MQCERALLTACEIADRLSVSVETVLRWHRPRRPPGGYRLASGVLRWREDEIEAWLKGSLRGVHPQQLTRARE